MRTIYYYYVHMMNSPSKYVKSKGLPSLEYTLSYSCLARSTIHKWYKQDFRKFYVFVMGCAYLHSIGVKPSDLKDYPSE